MESYPELRRQPWQRRRWRKAGRPARGGAALSAAAATTAAGPPGRRRAPTWVAAHCSAMSRKASRRLVYSLPSKARIDGRLCGVCRVRVRVRACACVCTGTTL